MTLNSELIAVRELNAGERIGYGGSFQVAAPMRIGIVACGYADGYPRHAPTGTPILVEGRRTRTLGRVSMDKICVDLTDMPAAGIGTPVTLWGEGLSADLVAAAAGTVSLRAILRPGGARAGHRDLNMAKARSIYSCTECGATAPKWQGQCPAAAYGIRWSNHSGNSRDESE